MKKMKTQFPSRLLGFPSECREKNSPPPPPSIIKRMKSSSCDLFAYKPVKSNNIPRLNDHSPLRVVFLFVAIKKLKMCNNLPRGKYK